MKVTILGGASFVGYWVKEGIRKRNPHSRFQIIDAPRADICLIKRYRDIFITQDQLHQTVLLKFSPQIIVINLYDLLSYSSLTFSVENNNLLINSINQLMDVAKEQKCTVLLIQNKNLYSTETIDQKGDNSYYQTYNTYNSFYYEYIKTFSSVYNIPLKVHLLPNVFGLYESPESAVYSITKGILEGKQLELSDGTRDFIYIKQVVPQIINYITKEENISIVSFTSGELTEIKSLYRIISNYYNRDTELKNFNDIVHFNRLIESREVTLERVKSDIKEDIIDYLSYKSQK